MDALLDAHKATSARNFLFREQRLAILLLDSKTLLLTRTHRDPSDRGEQKTTQAHDS